MSLATDRAATARSVMAEARSRARYNTTTAHHGERGVGCRDGVWFLATSVRTVKHLEDSALRFDADTEWSVICLDAVGPLVGKKQLRPHVFVQIRGKYLRWERDENDHRQVRVDQLVVEGLCDLGIQLVRDIRSPDLISDIKRWA